jgi:hypothetical protein
MPAARRQAAEYRAACGIFVQVERLRIEFRRECLDPVFMSPSSAFMTDIIFAWKNKWSWTFSKKRRACAS